MARIPLKKFTDYANNLLPHEVDYLIRCEQFESEDRQSILSQVYYNVHHPQDRKPFSLDIDKRKYNHVQKWISLRLNEIDVDLHLKFILSLEEKITNDTILPKEEKKLYSLIVNRTYSRFYLLQFYKLASTYKRYLLFRLRTDHYEVVNQFLKEARAEYEKSLSIEKKLDAAAFEIIDEKKNNQPFNTKWATILKPIFADDTISGQLRFRAFVLATFICYHSKNYDDLSTYLSTLDKEFTNGRFYTKRILLNFYNVKLMFYAHYHDYENAINYGELATRSYNEDHLLYANNLCAIYLKLDKYKDALLLMERSFSCAKESNNFHNRMSYISFYIKTLYKNDQMKKAINYGSAFLGAYRKEILRNRWFLFFSFYFEALLKAEKYSEIIYQVEKNKLLDRSKELEGKKNYMPIIPIIYYISMYKAKNISKEDFEQSINDQVNQNVENPKSASTIRSFMSSISSWLPELRSLYLLNQ